MIVVDASVWVDLLRGALPACYADRIRAAGCVSPPHVDFEVGSALLSYPLMTLDGGMRKAARIYGVELVDSTC